MAPHINRLLDAVAGLLGAPTPGAQAEGATAVDAAQAHAASLLAALFGDDAPVEPTTEPTLDRGCSGSSGARSRSASVTSAEEGSLVDDLDDFLSAVGSQIEDSHRSGRSAPAGRGVGAEEVEEVAKLTRLLTKAKLARQAGPARAGGGARAPRE